MLVHSWARVRCALLTILSFALGGVMPIVQQTVLCNNITTRHHGSCARYKVKVVALLPMSAGEVIHADVNIQGRTTTSSIGASRDSDFFLGRRIARVVRCSGDWVISITCSSPSNLLLVIVPVEPGWPGAPAEVSYRALEFTKQVNQTFNRLSVRANTVIPATDGDELVLGTPTLDTVTALPSFVVFMIQTIRPRSSTWEMVAVTTKDYGYIRPSSPVRERWFAVPEGAQSIKVTQGTPLAVDFYTDIPTYNSSNFLNSFSPVAISNGVAFPVQGDSRFVFFRLDDGFSAVAFEFDYETPVSIGEPKIPNGFYQGVIEKGVPFSSPWMPSSSTCGDHFFIEFIPRSSETPQTVLLEYMPAYDTYWKNTTIQVSPFELDTDCLELYSRGYTPIPGPVSCLSNALAFRLPLGYPNWVTPFRLQSSTTIDIRIAQQPCNNIPYKEGSHTLKQDVSFFQWRTATSVERKSKNVRLFVVDALGDFLKMTQSTLGDTMHLQGCSPALIAVKLGAPRVVTGEYDLTFQQSTFNFDLSNVTTDLVPVKDARYLEFNVVPDFHTVPALRLTRVQCDLQKVITEVIPYTGIDSFHIEVRFGDKFLILAYDFADTPVWVRRHLSPDNYIRYSVSSFKSYPQCLFCRQGQECFPSGRCMCHKAKPGCVSLWNSIEAPITSTPMGWPYLTKFDQHSTPYSYVQVSIMADVDVIPVIVIHGPTNIQAGLTPMILEHMNKSADVCDESFTPIIFKWGIVPYTVTGTMRSLSMPHNQIKSLNRGLYCPGLDQKFLQVQSCSVYAALTIYPTSGAGINPIIMRPNEQRWVPVVPFKPYVVISGSDGLDASLQSDSYRDFLMYETSNYVTITMSPEMKRQYAVMEVYGCASFKVPGFSMCPTYYPDSGVARCSGSSPYRLSTNVTTSFTVSVPRSLIYEFWVVYYERIQGSLAYNATSSLRKRVFLMVPQPPPQVPTPPSRPLPIPARRPYIPPSPPMAKPTWDPCQDLPCKHPAAFIILLIFGSLCTVVTFIVIAACIMWKWCKGPRAASTANRIIGTMSQPIEQPVMMVEMATLDEMRNAFGVIESDDDTCVVCLDNRKDVIFIPCKHYCACMMCASRMVICPMCRTTIISHRTVTQHQLEEILEEEKRVTQSPFTPAVMASEPISPPSPCLGGPAPGFDILPPKPSGEDSREPVKSCCEPHCEEVDAHSCEEIHQPASGGSPRADTHRSTDRGSQDGDNLS